MIDSHSPIFIEHLKHLQTLQREIARVAFKEGAKWLASQPDNQSWRDVDIEAFADLEFEYRLKNSEVKNG